MIEGPERVRFGNEGLDTILAGGLPARRLFLLEGVPGSGKTTLALQFLLEGVRRGERCLYVTLSETVEELESVTRSHGWSLDGVSLFDLAAIEEVVGAGREQSVLYSWEQELGTTVRLIQEEVERTCPTRIVLDSLSELRLLAQDPLRYRRQILALKQYFASRDSTVLLLDDMTGMRTERDTLLHSLCHGVMTLERLTLEFGGARRRLQIQKMRGVAFVAGYHDFVLKTGGLDIFPRLIASDHHRPFVGDPTPSGVPELDKLLGGGPLRGTSTLISGPAGSGKTTLALQYVFAACSRGERCIMFEFDERVGTLMRRADSFGLPLAPFVESGLLDIQQIDPSALSPGEFAARVRRGVENDDVRFVLIDSLSGYLAAMPQEQQLILQIHELLSYLNQQGVVTLMISPQHGLTATTEIGGLNVSYLADLVVMLRFFEASGRIRKAISVVKNRGSSHEDTIRELRVDAQGVRVGAPLSEFRGILTGTPEYVGTKAPLMEDRTGEP